MAYGISISPNYTVFPLWWLDLLRMRVFFYQLILAVYWVKRNLVGSCSLNDEIHMHDSLKATDFENS